ncbi:MAG: prolyl oligopeptidase family serine peptidase [Ahrensia sp.]|nr:prolyl oligopeptidase family serine peptidase [Ahrensia sp.]
MKILALLIVVGAMPLVAFEPTYACGADTDCKIGERTYRIQLPNGAEGPIGAIIFNHGYRGTAAGLMRNKSLSKAITDMGLAFVAPKSAFADWDIPNSPSQRLGQSEYSYFERLKADLMKRHGIDGDRIMVTGFSAGGMMTWELACRRGDLFAAYAPISGTFWAPVPPSCDTLPQPILHVHGTSDRVVPLLGRVIGPTKQGEVPRALELAAPAQRFGAWRDVSGTDGLTCQQRSMSLQNFVQFCTHPGGHSLNSAWVVRAWKVFERAGLL